MELGTVKASAFRLPLPSRPPIYNPLLNEVAAMAKLFDLTGRVAMVTGGNKGWARRWPGVLRGRGDIVMPAA